MRAGFLPLFSKKLRKGCCSLLLFVALCLVPPGLVRAESLTEYDVKAGFILNFLKFTEFKMPSTELLICVFDGEDVQKSLAALEREVLAGQRIIVRTLNDPVDVRNCSVAFVAKSADRLTKKVIRETQGKGILTIGESPSFAAAGGMINFYTESNRFRFEINVEAATREGLKLSSKLLRLARIITSPQEVKHENENTE